MTFKVHIYVEDSERESTEDHVHETVEADNAESIIKKYEDEKFVLLGDNSRYDDIVAILFKKLDYLYRTKFIVIT